jgi:hypothetical protein
MMSCHVLQARVPLVALLATDVDGFRKPGTRMWDFMCDHLNGGVKPSEWVDCQL